MYESHTTIHKSMKCHSPLRCSKSNPNLTYVLGSSLFGHVKHLLLFYTARRSSKNQNKYSKFDTSKLMSYQGHKTLLADKVFKNRFPFCFKLNYLQKPGFFKLFMFDLECANKFLIEI